MLFDYAIGSLMRRCADRQELPSASCTIQTYAARTFPSFKRPIPAHCLRDAFVAAAAPRRLRAASTGPVGLAFSAAELACADARQWRPGSHGSAAHVSPATAIGMVGSGRRSGAQRLDRRRPSRQSDSRGRPLSLRTGAGGPHCGRGGARPCRRSQCPEQPRVLPDRGRGRHATPGCGAGIVGNRLVRSQPCRPRRRPGKARGRAGAMA